MVQKRSKQIQTNQMRASVCMFVFILSLNQHDFGCMRCWSFTRWGKCTTIERRKKSVKFLFIQTAHLNARAHTHTYTRAYAQAQGTSPSPCIKSTIWISCLLINLPLNQSIYLSHPTNIRIHIHVYRLVYL